MTALAGSKYDLWSTKATGESQGGGGRGDGTGGDNEEAISQINNYSESQDDVAGCRRGVNWWQFLSKAKAKAKGVTKVK